jgi:hypothetical protein
MRLPIKPFSDPKPLEDLVGAEATFSDVAHMAIIVPDVKG